MSSSSLVGFNPLKLDLSVLNIDLTRIVSDIVSPQSGSESLARDFLKWLAREQISGSDYQYCIERTEAIAYPNDKGLELQKRISRYGLTFPNSKASHIRMTVMHAGRNKIWHGLAVYSLLCQERLGDGWH